MSAWICGVCGTPSSGDACPKCMTVRPSNFEGMNQPNTYASFIAGPGSSPQWGAAPKAGRLIIVVVGGLLLLVGIIASLRG
ncbi:MAG: hypothetical protein WCK51_03185 [Armatimonadota bacterium]